MKRTARTSGALIALAWALSSLPPPALSATTLRARAGQPLAPYSVMALPLDAVTAGLDAGLRQAPAFLPDLGGPLPLPQAPVPAVPGLASVPAVQVLGAPAPPAIEFAAPAGDATPKAVPTANAFPEGSRDGVRKNAVPTANAAPLGGRDGQGAVAPGGLPFSSPARGDGAPAQRQSIIGRVQDALGPQLDSGRLFDNSRAAAPAAGLGILPHKAPKNLPAGLIPDRAPSAPDPKQVSEVSIESFALSAGPVVLNADFADKADLERALRRMVDKDPVRFGVPSSELATLHLRRVPGASHQADTVFAYFRQHKNGLVMDGSRLSFTIKVLQGKPVLMAAMARLYPNTSVDTTPRLAEEALKSRALERLGPLAQARGVEAQPLERKIIYAKGAWRTANLYVVTGTHLAIAVDVATGEAFAWDTRARMVNNAAAGRVLGRTTVKGPTRPGAALAKVPLPDLNVQLGGGKTAVTDAAGRFSAKAARFKAALSGRWSKVSNAAGPPLSAAGALEKGKEAAVVFNPAGMSEDAIAQVNGYLLTTRVHDWAKAHGLNDARLDRALPVKVNLDDECNAYYMPGSPSLHFFRSSADCVNSSYDTVIMHEYGHFIDDMLGGIVNGGLSEGWGDIFSMYILDNPIIGEHFFKKPRGGPDYIRTGENTYQYYENDEAHAQGQAWGGFAWKLRQALMGKLGDAAGAALAETLVIPTMFAKAADIPAAMAQVLLADMDPDGKLPHAAEIRAAARAHGVDLAKRPGRP